MKTKICHITSVHNRYDGRIFKKQCKSLKNQGFDVVLLVNDLLNDEVIDDVQIVSTNHQTSSRIRRFINSGSMLLKKAVEIDAEIYHLHDPDLLIVGNKLKKLGKKVIFDSHEDFPIDISEKEWIPNILRKVISKIYMVYEKKSIRNYDAVITVSPHIVERLKEINPNTFMITNYPIIKDNIGQSDYVYELRNNIICFAGSVNKDWGHHVAIDAIEEIDNVKYILVGPSSDCYMSELTQKKSWSKTDYRGVVDFSEVQKIYNEAKVGIAIHYTKSLDGKGTLGNTKLFEFMEAGLPVICSDYPLWDEIVKKYNCGISVNPRDINEVKRAIEYILSNPVEAKKMGGNGVKAVHSEYNWKSQEPILIKVYTQLSETKV